jgi:hypothetical protein
MTNHLFEKIRAAIEGRESRLFLETPAGLRLNLRGNDHAFGQYAEALSKLRLKPGDRVARASRKSVEAPKMAEGVLPDATCISR